MTTGRARCGRRASTSSGWRIGEPELRLARAHAIEAAHKAALHGDTKYPPQDGTPALKAAIQRKFRRDNRLDFALDEIIVSNGGKQAIFNACMATVDPGDEVVIPVAVVERLCADGEGCRRRAGVRHLPAEQRLQAARRGHRGGDHAEDQVADAEQSRTTRPARAVARRTACDRRRDAAAPACLGHVGRHVRASGVRRLQAATIAAGGAGAAGPHGDDQRRVQDLCNDRLAHRLCRRARSADQGDGQHAGPGDGRRVHCRPGGGGGGAGRAAGRRGRADRRLRAAPRHGGGDAERLPRHQLPQAGRRILRVSRTWRAASARPGGGRRIEHRHGLRAWRCWRRRTSLRAWRGIWHVAVYAHQLRDG